MPFAAPARPAWGLSLLKACLEAQGIACDVAYFNLVYARLLGLEVYGRVTEEIPPAALAGEWVFKDASTGAAGDPPDRFLQRILEDRWCVQEPALESVRCPLGCLQLHPPRA